MIATLKGSLISKSANTAIIEAAGIGYQLTMPTPDLGSLPPLGQAVRVYTFLQIKDDAINLYGFESETKKDLFIRLIGVGNVGPKAAVGLLSHLSPEQLVQAIVSEDIGLISSAPGIGRKTAQRVVLELKDKLGLGEAGPAGPGASSALVEAREALVGLGYGADEAAAALTGADGGQPADWYVKYALKRLART